MFFYRYRHSLYANHFASIKHLMFLNLRNSAGKLILEKFLMKWFLIGRDAFNVRYMHALLETCILHKWVQIL